MIDIYKLNCEIRFLDAVNYYSQKDIIDALIKHFRMSEGFCVEYFRQLLLKGDIEKIGDLELETGELFIK